MMSLSDVNKINVSFPFKIVGFFFFLTVIYSSKKNYVRLKFVDGKTNI